MAGPSLLPQVMRAVRYRATGPSLRSYFRHGAIRIDPAASTRIDTPPIVLTCSSPDATGQDVRGAVQHLKATGSAKVGVTGFCMGGALTLLAAVNVPEADASVAWYGFPPLEYIDASKITAPLLCHFAERDEFCPVAKVDELEKKLRAGNVKFELHRYDAKHAFANEEANDRKLPPLEYNKQAADHAWQSAQWQ